MKIKSRKIRGSSLPIVLIISFVILITVSALAYNFHRDLGTIRVLLKDDNYEQINQDNVDDIPDNIPDSDYTIGTQIVGDYKFINNIITVDPLFYTFNTNSELYNAEPHVINYQIKHEIYHKDVRLSAETVSINKLPDYALEQYSEKLIPLNIPYLNIKSFTEDQKENLLDSNGRIIDSFNGNVGYLEKEQDMLVVNIGNESQTIDLKSYKLDENYNVSIGWNLIKGHWEIMLAIYDQDHLLISSTKLESLEESSTLNQIIVNLSDFKTIHNENSLVDVAMAKWYFNSSQQLPRLLLATGEEQNENRVDVRLYDVFYETRKSRYEAEYMGEINDIGQITPAEFHITPLDSNMNLGTSDVFILAGDKLYDLGKLSDKKISNGDKEEISLNLKTEKPPIFVKKADGSFYVITYDSNGYNQYSYTLSSKVISGQRVELFNNENLEKIIVKDGVKYAITDKSIYVINFANEIINRINVSEYLINHNQQNDEG
ncbi:hypothetical protein LO80_04975 [Candidatus Francisella endociliophora]|uniref:Uncharacterized protein n=1 Tax=Candidatus Francisella endociliophora TaxID=653937 RepID=A0A097EP93_9GAMM|nr:hypothetical protein [Francisella sp. FSC1006]AIT09383.1 hypothetical protein LO80_04975 [Francisella sp. FSC1006]